MYVATSTPWPALGTRRGSVVLCLLLASKLFSLRALTLRGLSNRASTFHSHLIPEAALPGVAIGSGTQWNDTCSTSKLYFLKNERYLYEKRILLIRVSASDSHFAINENYHDSTRNSKRFQSF